MLTLPSTVVSGKTASATVTVTKPNLPGVPTGTVHLLYAGEVLGSAVLSNGEAIITVSTAGIPVGSYALNAVYLGDAQDAVSSSVASTVTVTKK